MMKALDEKIREEYPDVYKKVENKVVWTIRRSGYLLYYLGHFCMSLKEKKYERRSNTDSANDLSGG